MSRQARGHIPEGTYHVNTRTAGPVPLFLDRQYAQNFNRQHRRSGHLHGDRYHAEPVVTDGRMLHAVRYVARNPVEGGLCGSPADWLWSSYRSTAGLDGGFAFVDDAAIRDYFGGDGEDAIRLLRNFVEGS